MTKLDVNPAGGQTAILNKPPRRIDQPWYRRIDWPEPRYIALIVAGVLVLGAGAAYAITQLAGGSSSSDSGSPAQQGDLGSSPVKSKTAAVDPSKVTVAVLNGTRIPGLAARVKHPVRKACVAQLQCFRNIRETALARIC